MNTHTNTDECMHKHMCAHTRKQGSTQAYRIHTETLTHTHAHARAHARAHTRTHAHPLVTISILGLYMAPTDVTEPP